MRAEWQLVDRQLSRRRLVLAGCHRTPEGPAQVAAPAASEIGLWVISWKKSKQ
jgi:hypothetical protein